MCLMVSSIFKLSLESLSFIGLISTTTDLLVIGFGVYGVVWQVIETVD
jgi:hypothetical protein